MKCPLCRENILEQSELTSGLVTYSCNNCKGSWLRFDDYMNWLNEARTNTFEVEDIQDENFIPVPDSKQAKLCPDCGRILLKYLVNNSLDFYLDHCGNCNGVWLDQSEWESLRRNGIHKEINKFFTNPWQSHIRADILKERLDKKYLEKFGVEDYEKLKNIKTWLDNNNKRHDILAFLMDEDPYNI